MPSTQAVASPLQSIATPPPATGRWTEVLPGIRWLRMPLPYSIDHINLWLIQDGDGWALVDTGVCTNEVKQAWGTLLHEAEEPIALTRVLVTHMHPDHVGLAGWLHERYGVPLAMTRQEYLTCRLGQADAPPGEEAHRHRYFRGAGWSDTLIANLKLHDEQQRQYIHPLPSWFRPLHDGDAFPIGAHLWQVVVGQGHTPEHACLYCPALQVLISGDQVLPRISSNLSVHPMQPGADPMAQWFYSMQRIRQRVPGDVLVLPAHNQPFHGLHARLDTLAQDQRRSLDRLRAALATPQRVIDLFGPLFKRTARDDDPGLMALATGEALACLNHLLGLGEIKFRTDRDGVNWYALK